MQYVNNPGQSFASLDFTKEQARFHMQKVKDFEFVILSNVVQQLRNDYDVCASEVRL